MKTWSYILLCLLLFTVAISQAHADEKQQSALWQQGPLQQAKAKLGMLVNLKFLDGRVQVNTEHWVLKKNNKPGNVRVMILTQSSPRHSVVKLHFDGIFADMKQGKGKGSSKFEKDKYVTEHAVDNLKGILHQPRRTALTEFVYMKLEEQAAPKRTFIFEKKKGLVHIEIKTKDEHFLLKSDKKLTLKYAANGQLKEDLSYESFAALYADKMTLCDEVIFPLLKHFGVTLPRLPSDKAVGKLVVESLSISSENDKTAFAKLITEMEADEYEVREQALETLTKSYLKYRNLIEAKLRDDATSVEVRSQLEALGKVKSHKEVADSSQSIVKGLNLKANKRYLAKLLDGANEEQKAFLFHQLKQLTKEDHGADVKKWQEAVQ